MRGTRVRSVLSMPHTVVCTGGQFRHAGGKTTGFIQVPLTVTVIRGVTGWDGEFIILLRTFTHVLQSQRSKVNLVLLSYKLSAGMLRI